MMSFFSYFIGQNFGEMTISTNYVQGSASPRLSFGLLTVYVHSLCLSFETLKAPERSNILHVDIFQGKKEF